MGNLKALITKHEFKNFLEKNAVYVKDCQDNRVYLKQEYLKISQKGLILMEANHSEINLSELLSDSEGIYTRIETLKTDVATVYPIVYCHTCKAWRMINIKEVCGRCGNAP